MPPLGLPSPVAAKPSLERLILVERYLAAGVITPRPQSCRARTLPKHTTAVERRPYAQEATQLS